jgi:hypothetical protein
MKAMWLSFVAIVAISIVAAGLLSSVDYTAAEKFSTDSVRID